MYTIKKKWAVSEIKFLLKFKLKMNQVGKDQLFIYLFSVYLFMDETPPLSICINTIITKYEALWKNLIVL